MKSSPTPGPRASEKFLHLKCFRIEPIDINEHFGKVFMLSRIDNYAYMMKFVTGPTYISYIPPVYIMLSYVVCSASCCMCVNGFCVTIDDVKGKN